MVSREGCAFSFSLCKRFVSSVNFVGVKHCMAFWERIPIYYSWSPILVDDLEGCYSGFSDEHDERMNRLCDKRASNGNDSRSTFAKLARSRLNSSKLVSYEFFFFDFNLLMLRANSRWTRI
jgi:hypothetical protein